jgi:DNA-binding NarL/FixJ family response regulator
VLLLERMLGELSISVNTVNTHRARILEKMGMRANAELIRYAIEHGLTE